MELKKGSIKDFSSGIAVRATPEEVDAVQVFSKMLVDDYGYPKDLIQTRPQWSVKVRPSDTKKEYPVDIVVVSDKTHTEDSSQIIIECKKTTGKMEEHNYKTTFAFLPLNLVCGSMEAKNCT